MKRFLLLAVASISVLILAACQSGGEPTVMSTSTAAQTESLGGPLIVDLQTQGIAPLSTDEIVALHVGHRLRHTHLIDNTVALIRYREDGIREVTVRGRTTNTTYRIEDDKRCEASIVGGTICITFYRVDDRLYGCDDRNEGVCDWLVEVIE